MVARKKWEFSNCEIKIEHSGKSIESVVVKEFVMSWTRGETPLFSRVGMRFSVIYQTDLEQWDTHYDHMHEINEIISHVNLQHDVFTGDPAKYYIMERKYRFKM